MLLPKEYLLNGMPESGELWLNALDIVDHCLQGDCQQSFYKDDRPSKGRFEEWSYAMSQRATWDDQFQELFENSYKPQPKWSRLDDDCGDLQVDSFISGDEYCFESYEKRQRTKNAVSVLFDGNVSWGERHDKYMETRHKEAYKIAAQCEADRIPCRVIVVLNDVIPEISGTLKTFLIVKDYLDPIFPGIWGTFTNNLTTNAFINVIMDYFVGTHTPGNGRPVALKNVRSYFPEDEEITMFGDHLIDD